MTQLTLGIMVVDMKQIRVRRGEPQLHLALLAIMWGVATWIEYWCGGVTWWMFVGIVFFSLVHVRGFVLTREIYWRQRS